MEWYKIVAIIPTIVLGAYLRDKIYETKTVIIEMMIGRKWIGSRDAWASFFIYQMSPKNL